MDASYTPSQHQLPSEHESSSPIQQSYESANGTNGNGYDPSSSPSPAVGGGQQLESESMHQQQQSQRSVGGGGNEGLTAGQIARKKLMGYVGFANLPNQVHRKRCV
jgi:hypothetical protein